ncbi:MAG: MBL fold metallo-hydrolase [Acidimicrobiia bacterium]|nr:MBL fold metallo-hydrolase [Acidimicrobiia bacterium]
MSHSHDHEQSPRPRKQEQEDASEEISEVAPGVLRAQLPISLPGLGHVNCYLIEDERGIAVVDPGLPGDDNWANLEDRLTRAGYAVSDIHTVVITHSHPDHFGAAHRLRVETDADILTHESFRSMWDTKELDDHEDSAELETNTFDAQLEAMERHFSAPTPWGGTRERPSPDFVKRARAAARQGRNEFAIPNPSISVSDGETVSLARREWVAMHTPGHTYDHLCLFDAENGVMLTGDHVLPSITPHISGMTPEADPLALFFDSLNRMIDMTDVTMALPAHGHPFTDLGGRAQRTIDHHEERLNIIREAVHNLPNGTVPEFMKVLFKERSWGDMAESETYAHLEHLRELDELVRTDPDGYAHYAPVD